MTAPTLPEQATNTTITTAPWGWQRSFSTSSLVCHRSTQESTPIFSYWHVLCYLHWSGVSSIAYTREKKRDKEKKNKTQKQKQECPTQ